jgi:hypothetical protein
MKLSDYVGTFTDKDSGLVYSVDVQNDRLMSTLSGQKAYRVWPMAQDAFRYRVVDAKLAFTRTPAGVVNAVVLFQNGHRVVFVKPGMPAPSAAPDVFPPIVALSAIELDQYVGNYTSSIGTFFVTSDDQQLSVRLSGQPAAPVFSSAKDTFFYKIVDAQITFIRDPSGHVASLVLHQNGADFPAQRDGSQLNNPPQR